MAVARTSTGSLFSSAASGTATFAAGATAGDLGILIVETANQAITTPSGWTLDRQTGTGSAGAAGATMLSFYHKSGISAGDISGGISISDSGDHQNALLLTYSGSDNNGRYGAGTPISITNGNAITPASTTASTNGIGSAGTIVQGDILLAVIVTDRDSATVSTNTSPVWTNITGSDSFIVNVSSATGAGGGIIVSEFVPNATATGTPTFSCSITSSIMVTAAAQIFCPTASAPFRNYDPLLPLLVR